MNYVICCLAYGPAYTKTFTDNFVKSCMDETNLPAISKNHNVDFLIFSDNQSLQAIGPHELVGKLADTVTITAHPFINTPTYAERYEALGRMLRTAVKFALEKNACLSVFASDAVVSKNFFPKMISKIEEGYGAVFGIPMRAALEVCNPVLAKAPGAFSEQDLFALAYNNMHPLWNASHYEAAQFSKMPYTMLWNSGKGCMARSFSISPMIFKVTEKMLQAGMLDYDVPSMCENPFWATDWMDCPLIGAEPMTCFYPPFANHKATPEFVGGVFAQHLHPGQMQFVEKKFYFPTKEQAQCEALEAHSDKAIADMLEAYNAMMEKRQK